MNFSKLKEPRVGNALGKTVPVFVFDSGDEIMCAKTMDKYDCPIINGKKIVMAFAAANNIKTSMV